MGVTVTVDPMLTVAPARESLTVTAGGRVLDRQSTAIVETIDSRQLADLPGSRSVAALLAVSQRLHLPETEVGGSGGVVTGQYSAYGKNSSPRHTVEGIIVTGLFGAGFTMDYGSFEEAAILTGAHGAEWPTAGIHTQFVTKSGGNRYGGTLYADYENRRWQSFNVDEEQSRRVGGARGANRLSNYRDINADVGGFVVRDRLWWYASMREQEISLQLPNFPVRPNRTRLTNFSGKATYRIAPGNTLVAYAQRGHNHQPNRLDPFAPAGLSAVTAINESEDSTINQHNAALVWKTEWESIVDDALLFEVRVGQFAPRQDWTPQSGLPRFEDIDTLRVSGGNRNWESRHRRDQLFGTLTHFRDGRTGSHQLKVGGEMTRFLVREQFSAYPGNVVHVLRNGRPSEVFLFEAPSASAGGVWAYSAYAADSWRPQNRLTLNLGVRFDRYRLFLPAQEHATATQTLRFAAIGNLIDWNSLVPRIGAVYDLSGDGRTLSKLAFSRYRAAPGAAVAFNANPNTTEWWTRYVWMDGNGSGAFEPGEEGRVVNRRPGAVESIDPGLELPVVNELAGWIERQLVADLRLRSGVVWRGEHHNFSRQNINQPFEAFTVPVVLRDPGPDGRAETADDGPALLGYELRPEFVDLPRKNVVRNIPGSRSDYWTWEIDVTRRARGRWSLTAGFAHTWNRDHAAGYSGQTVRNNTYPLTPNDLINAGAGGQHVFTTWVAKAHGTYEAPWGVRITPLLRHQSGQAFGRTFTTSFNYASVVTVLVEPVGTRRLDNVTIFDVRVEKSVRLRQSRRLAGFVDLFNCFNANPVQNAVWSSGPAYLRPADILAPRIARVGVKLDW